jgi:hypothetical protein
MAGNDYAVLVTVRGIVIPLVWAEDGSVTTVGISGFDEQDFIIRSAPGLGHWLSLLRREVEVRGVLSAEGPGLKTIDVRDYRVMDTGDEDEAT